MIRYTMEDGYEFVPDSLDDDSGLNMREAAQILEVCVKNNDELDVDYLHERQYETIVRALYPEIEQAVRETEEATHDRFPSRPTWYDATEMYLADAINSDSVRALIEEMRPWTPRVNLETKMDICEHFADNCYKGVRYEPASVCRASNSKDDRDLYLVCCRAAANERIGAGDDSGRPDYASWVWNEAERKAYMGSYGLSEDECHILMEDRFNDMTSFPGMEGEINWIDATMADIGEGFRDKMKDYKEKQAIEERRKAFMAAYERTHLADGYRLEDTVRELVNAIGADGAQTAIAELVDTVHVDDGRISKRSREWANSIITPGVTAAHDVHNDPFVHPANIDAFAGIMREFMAAIDEAVGGKDNEAQAPAEQPARRKGR